MSGKLKEENSAFRVVPCTHPLRQKSPRLAASCGEALPVLENIKGIKGTIRHSLKVKWCRLAHLATMESQTMQPGSYRQPSTAIAVIPMAGPLISRCERGGVRYSQWAHLKMCPACQGMQRLRSDVTPCISLHTGPDGPPHQHALPECPPANPDITA
eukprot:1161501-Pelagomonas_calceolata.AAC.9